MDLVFPKNNEELLLKEAQMLGHKNILYCYTEKKVLTKDFQTKRKELPSTVQTAVLLDSRNNISKLKNKVDVIMGLAQREYFEDKRVDAICGAGLESRRDHTHFRKSLTQVEAALAQAQGKQVFFLFSDVLSSKQPEEILGRWSQDKTTFGKTTVSCELVSGANNILGLRSRKDLENFWKVL